MPDLPPDDLVLTEDERALITTLRTLAISGREAVRRIYAAGPVAQGEATAPRPLKPSGFVNPDGTLNVPDTGTAAQEKAESERRAREVRDKKRGEGKTA